MKKKFNDVYTECRDSVYGYLLYMTKDVQLAEDLSQETFLRIFLGLGRFKGDSKVKTWALKIARNVFMSYARKKRPILLEEQELFQRKETAVGAPEELILQREEGTKIQQLLMTLNEQERTILLLRDYEELSYEEIASILEINVGMTKSRLYRARQKFKKLYDVMDEQERKNDHEREN